ncbi:glycosyltransferase involved in cell wall biosynthesis [Psychrobacter sp. PL19]|uniref:glycosyltransferase family 2 protein n=1 Tax=Psychrobacter sp. PL19 TaxID=2760711 RepID=UPI001AE3561C
MNLVTIIIPMYNEQENIKNCIKVLRSQKNQNFDAVFIDDGSTDSTVKEVESCLDLGVDFNYKVIKQTNKGAAEARRIGIENSSTKFVMIFDCDDNLSDDMVSEVYTQYVAYPNVDIIMPNMLLQNSNKDWNDLIFYTKETILEPLDCIENSIGGWHVHGCLAVRKTVFEKSYKSYKSYNVKNTNYINNDEVITRLNFLNSKVIIRSKATYYYCYNAYSTTKRVNHKKYLMIKNSLILYNIFKDEKKIIPNVTSELVSGLWGNFRYMQKHKIEIENIAEWKKEIKVTLKHIKYFKVIKNINLKKKIQLAILQTIFLL